MNPKSRKIRLSRESLVRLAVTADRPVENVFPSRPPVCEQTNFITCAVNCG